MYCLCMFLEPPNKHETKNYAIWRWSPVLSELLATKTMSDHSLLDEYIIYTHIEREREGERGGIGYCLICWDFA